MSGPSGLPEHVDPMLATLGSLPLPGTDQTMAYTEDYLNTHQILIRSPLIIGGAIQKGQLQKLPSLAGNDNPVGAVIDASASLFRSTSGYAAMWPAVAVPVLAVIPFVVVLTRVHSQRKDRSETFSNVHVLRVVGGKMTELREYMGDERREDEFWRS